MPTQDDIDQQLRRLDAHRATLAHYLDQVSLLGAAHTPPGVGHGVREARDGIARCKAALRTWGVPVEDHPDDENTPPPAAPPGAAEVERELRATLPAEAQAQAPGLARLLTDLATGAISPEALAQRLAADPALAQMLRSLIGEQLSLDATVLSFAEGSHVGDVSIWDIYNGNVVTVNVYHGAPTAAPLPAQPPAAPGERRRLKIFLCHSSADKAAVRRLSRLLAEGGADPWLDEEQLIPGQDWRRAIPAAVEQSDVALVCLSKDAVSREGYLRDEIAFALSVAERRPAGEIFLVPLLLEPCEVPERLARWHWVSLAEPQGMGRLQRALRARAAELGAVAPELSADGWQSVPPAHEDPPTNDPKAPPPAAINPRDPRLVIARGLIIQKQWAAAVSRYEELAAEGALPPRDASNLDRARQQRWLQQTRAQAEQAETGWDWAAAATLWAEIVRQYPDDTAAAARLQRARDEQALAEQAQDAADLIGMLEWDGVLATINELLSRRPDYAHPAIDLAALQRQAQTALAYELAVEQAERGEWAALIATLSAADLDLSAEGKGLLAHAQEAQRAEERRQAQEAEAQRAAEEQRRRQAALAAAIDLVKAGHHDDALARLSEIAADPATQGAAAAYAARLAETAAVPFAARLQFAQLAGRLGDPRSPVSPDDWRREIGRRGERFGPQPWGELPPPYLCYVPAGTYRIGGWKEGQESADIALPTFWIARLPISMAQYAAFVSAGGRPAPEWGKTPYEPNRPTTKVTWLYAVAYCAWLSKQMANALPAGYILRLPSEAEWEVAAAYDAAGQRRSYPWGEDEPTIERAVYDASDLNQPAPVGCCPAGAAACGALDMVGNVWEPSASDYTDYPDGSHASLKTGFMKARTSWRGGAHLKSSAHVSCASRDPNYIDGWYTDCGFRLVVAPPLEA